MTLRLASLTLLAFLALLVSLLVGGTVIPFSQVGYAMLHPHAPGDVHVIVWGLRFPRVCIAAIVGASLGIAGAMLQGMLRNPLVDPYLTGVSAGAAAAIALAIAAGVAAPIVPALGFGAGLATAVLVAALARRGSGIDANRLILAGVSLSALFSAIVALVLTRLQQGGYAQAILAWLAGSLAGRGWHDLIFAAPYAALGLILAVLSVPALNALRLGDLRARTVGVDVDRAQWMILASASLLTASAVSLSGIVGFIGLIVPHIVRRIIGSDARLLIVGSAIAGGGFMALADAASRSLFAPIEIPIGVLLAFIGVPTFLYLYLRPGRKTA
ncbi:MAG: iron ABC transporter permease [Candidatus Baltobacteraceae bacterium]